MDSTKSHFLLVGVAAIWGFAFVAQRVGMDTMGPFIFNGIRFSLGTITLLPLLYKQKRNAYSRYTRWPWKYGIIAGMFLCMGTTAQQIGLVYTTAGKAGFITGLYMIFVPFFSIILGKSVKFMHWVGACIALGGLFLLTFSRNLSINYGDFLVFFSAIFFAMHVIFVGKIASQVVGIELAFQQFFVCALLSLILSFIIEKNSLSGVLAGWQELLYGGVFSVGVAYTFQIIAQKNTHPTSAAIIMSMESVFAVIGGVIFLNEILSFVQVVGCLLMLIGMFFAQLRL